MFLRGMRAHPIGHAENSDTRCSKYLNITSYCLVQIFTHLILMECSTLIIVTSPFPWLGLLSCRFHFHLKFNRTFCSQTVDALIRRRALTWVCNDFLYVPHKGRKATIKDYTTLIFATKYKTYNESYHLSMTCADSRGGGWWWWQGFHYRKCVIGEKIIHI